MATGRSSPKYAKFQLEDTGGVLRDIPVMSFGEVGITYDELDVSAFQDVIKGFMAGMGTFALTISGPFDNSAAVAASGSGAAAGASLSGSHTVLSALNGGLTPRAFGVYFGIQANWATGDPVFGGDNSVIVTSYVVNFDTATYTAKIAHVGAGTAPAWGTTAIVAS